MWWAYIIADSEPNENPLCIWVRESRFLHFGASEPDLNDEKKKIKKKLKKNI